MLLSRHSTLITYTPLVIILLLLYYVSEYNYLLFHTLAEGFAIVISCIISIFVFLNYNNLPSNFIPILGITYGFSNVFVILHTLAYKGLGILNSDANLPTQMWIIARYLDSSGMLIAGLSLERKIPLSNLAKAYFSLVLFLLLAIFLQIFPDCFVEGQGLTPFKIYSEYVICLILAISMFILQRHKSQFRLDIYRYLQLFFITSIFTELSMTAYVQVYGIMNIVGHLWQIMSYYFLYRAVVETSLREPFNKLAELNEKLKIEITRREQLQAKFASVFSESSAAIAFVRYDDFVILDVNREWERLTGYKREEIVNGITLSDLNIFDIPFTESEIFSQLKKNGILREDYKFKNVNNEARIGEVSMFVTKTNGDHYIILKLIDVTNQRKMEEEMARFSNLNIIGEIAAGIGHEVRNPMTTVRGYLQMLQRKQDFSDYNEQFGIMIEELDRANSIISEFLSLAKNKSVEMKYGNLNNVIHSLFPLLQADAFCLGHDLQVHLKEIPKIKFDEKEIRQLILNLVRNGLESMNNSGKITIETYCNASQVLLVIQDNGEGIPDEVMKRLGTPFVTTKDNGTGLGIPICYRIAERHSAELKIVTSPQGTTVTVIFNTLF
ncbi:MASE3 domain-containing protein [Dendrosporobacter sp. 1207_IL3150]|uniref:MASE3 domain-containing protein n=1 Tax=Dendrosporobacter sp. 1207_IL3150 TaxID=3084054 RepID=UPI002FDACA85